MKVNLYATSGDVTGEVELPEAFATPLRPDIIRKTVSAFQANRRQPYGSDPMAGKKQAVESWGTGRGAARVPRRTQGSQAAFIPGAVGGRRAHPPKAEKDWSEKVNRKEKALALRSAVAATADPVLVAARGHRFRDDLTLPLVVEDGMDEMMRTQELLTALEALGVAPDVARAKDGRSIRAGRGKRRGRRYRTPTSLLLVTLNPEGVLRAAGNLPGVEVTTPEQLNVERVAPGGDPGRLTIFTASALEALGGTL